VIGGLGSFYRVCLCCGAAAAAAASSDALSHSLDRPNQESASPQGDLAIHPVTVEDVVQMVTLGDDAPYNNGILSAGQFAAFSPNGKSFVVVLRKGNLKVNRNEYSVLLWRVDDLNRGKSAEWLFTLSSSSNRPAIEDLRWLSDNETLTFVGEMPAELHQLYRYNIKTHKLVQETRSQTNVVDYSETPDGRSMLYTAEESNADIFDDKTPKQDGAVITSQPIGQILNRTLDSYHLGVQLLYQRRESDSAVKLAGKLFAAAPPALSPDGQYAIVRVRVSEVPVSWGNYTDSEDPYFRLNLSAARGRSDESTLLEQYWLISIDTKESRVLLNSPTGSNLGSEAAWAPDSRSVIITNSFLPLDQVDESERQLRASRKFAVEVEVGNGTVIKIGGKDLHSPVWDRTNGCLRFSVRKNDLQWNSGPSIFYRKKKGRWQEVRHDVCDASTRPIVMLKEGLNMPPSIMIEDSSTHRRSVLLDLNPQFKQLKMAREEEFHWRGLNGELLDSGLYYPVNYVAGEKYPLVIQTHGFNPDRFWIDGPYSGTAFSAQPLAGRNIMVVQLDERDDDVGSSQELAREVSRIETAVNELDRKGLIDRKRIGIIGFSRTCLFVKYLLAQSKLEVAAATTADGVDDGYFQYLLENSVGFQKLSEEAIGSAPFGVGLKLWFSRSPGFSLENVRSPLRIEALNPYSALFQWEWFAGLRRLGKPVEMILIRDGEHILKRPWERLISQQGNVDWFDFWLNDHDNSDPAKAEQYKRWRELKKLHKADVVGLQAPLVH